MGVLLNLDGVKKIETTCTFLKKPSDIRWILRKGHAGTIAGNRGAVNIWKDDDGYFRCESFRYCITIETKRYKYISIAEKWVKKWMKVIK